jgi:hypothetical protein
MRANINPRTRCSTDVSYQAKKTDKPVVNKRTKYANNTLIQDVVDTLVRRDQAWKEQFPGTVEEVK